jgi:hypothetical protein
MRSIGQPLLSGGLFLLGAGIALWSAQLVNDAHVLAAMAAAAGCGGMPPAEPLYFGHCAACWRAAAAVLTATALTAVGVWLSPLRLRPAAHPISANARPRS